MEEKKELRQILFDKIEKVKGDKDLNQIFKIVVKLNDYLDEYDTKFENLIDKLTLCFTKGEISKIKKIIDDILDKYDKINKKSNQPFYSEEKKQTINSLIKQIDDICNKNFWERMKDTLRIGS